MSGVTHHIQTAQANNPAYDVSHDAWDGDHDVTDLSVTGQMALAGVISPAKLTSSQTDWNPTGLSGASVIRLSADPGVVIRSMAGGAPGREIILVNTGTNSITLASQYDTGTTAAMRFALVGGSFSLEPDCAARLWYDGVSLRWRVGTFSSSIKAQNLALQGTGSGNALMLSSPYGTTLLDGQYIVIAPNTNLPDAGAMLVQSGDSASLIFNAVPQAQTQPVYDTTIFPNCSAVITGLPFIVPGGGLLDIQAGAFFGINR